MVASSNSKSPETYDVAISFLVADEKIAAAIKAGLIGLNVFFYPHNQEELIGTNGIESMRAPFLGARVNVIVFRERYGKTPWTGVELSAIQDSCLKSRYECLVFVQLDKKDSKPDWLPDTHIRCVLGDFTAEQLIGAIKSKVQQRGGTIRRSDARTEAFRVRQEADYLADKDRLMRDGIWIGQIQRAIQSTKEDIRRIVDELNAGEGFQIQFGMAQGEVVTVLRTEFVSMAVGWQQPISNYVGDSGEFECHLWATEYVGKLSFHNEDRWFLEQPMKLDRHFFKVGVAQDRSLIWKVKESGEHVLPSELGDYIVRLLLDLISRHNQGKIKRPMV